MTQPLKLADVKAGDLVQGFEGWGCIPDDATREIKLDAQGRPFVDCSHGQHLLDAQTDCHDHLLGMKRAPPPV